MKDSLNIANAPSEQVKANLRTTYGMNIQSPFCVLTTFDVTKQLPQVLLTLYSKVMINMKHGWSLLLYIRNGTLTLDRINDAILSHPYGSSETSSKPGPIRESVFSSEEVSSLKFDALQTRLFLRLVPFFINTFVDMYFLKSIRF